jgi:hypothetical protein
MRGWSAWVGIIFYNQNIKIARSEQTNEMQKMQNNSKYNAKGWEKTAQLTVMLDE